MPTKKKTFAVSAGARIRDPEATRQRILDAATAEFSRLGLGGARVDTIAERANANKRMIYHYYGGKQALFLAVLENAYGAIRTAERKLDLEHLDPVPDLGQQREFAQGQTSQAIQGHSTDAYTLRRHGGAPLGTRRQTGRLSQRGRSSPAQHLYRGHRLLLSHQSLYGIYHLRTRPHDSKGLKGSTGLQCRYHSSIAKSVMR
jgi:AcrR family transcriptional regulator